MVVEPILALGQILRTRAAGLIRPVEEGRRPRRLRLRQHQLLVLIVHVIRI